MPESPRELLERHRLTGSYQVHIHPVVLTCDRRAHQIFYGFSATQLADIVQDQFPIGTTVIGDNPAIIPAQDSENPGGLAGLDWVVRRLMGPGGCPWDIAQTHESLKKYLIEESYELIAAIDDGDLNAMAEELGDVLLQPLMHAEIERRAGRQSITQIADLASEKLIRRHPHVFGDAVAHTPEDVLARWDSIKRAERAEAGKPGSILTGIPASLPALMLAMEISKRAARAGFEWPDMDSVWEKFHEEEREFREALESGDTEHIAAELGDLLFTVVNLARWAKIDPEDALRTMAQRFRRRFELMGQSAGKPLTDLSPEEWDLAWNAAKSALR